MFLIFRYCTWYLVLLLPSPPPMMKINIHGSCHRSTNHTQLQGWQLRNRVFYWTKCVQFKCDRVMTLQSKKQREMVGQRRDSVLPEKNMDIDIVSIINIYIEFSSSWHEWKSRAPLEIATLFLHQIFNELAFIFNFRIDKLLLESILLNVEYDPLRSSAFNVVCR